MSQSNQLLVTDIDDMSINIKLENIQTDDLKKMAKSLSFIEFKTVSTKAMAFFDFIDSNVPMLVLSGKGYEISLLRKKLVLSYLGGVHPFHMLDVERELVGVKKEQLFSKENLDSTDADFNFIIGLISGKLGIQLENTEIEARVLLEKKGKFKNDFTNLFTPESKLLFGKVFDMHIKEIRFKTEEELFGTKVQTSYDLDEIISETDKTSSIRCTVNLEFRHSIPLDTFKFLESILSRVNTLTQSLAGGIVV